MKQPVVYILASQKNGTLYTGVTSDLFRRVYEHKNASLPGFSHKYGCKMLVYYESHQTIESAIIREKQIKSGSRQKKIDMINLMNPDWKDLYDHIL